MIRNIALNGGGLSKSFLPIKLKLVRCDPFMQDVSLRILPSCAGTSSVVIGGSDALKTDLKHAQGAIQKSNMEEAEGL